jgi:HTH-type transcriptional regulator/antitoxin HigA
MSDSPYIEDATHPGEFLREELEARGWSQRDLAYVLGTPEQAVNMILSGKRGISPEMAKALGKVFDVHPDLFANLQRAFDMARAREPDPAVERRARLQSVYPVREMIKRGWLENTDIAMTEAQLVRFFEAKSPDDIPKLAHAAKKTSYERVTPAQLAWLYRVRQLAREMVAPRYSEKRLTETLQQFQQFMTDPEEARHVPRALTECGVRLVIVETLPGAKIDGVCSWLDGVSPVIGLSTRYDRIDNFWFVLRHECEHVLQKHGRDEAVVDVELEGERASDSDTLPAEERIANRAAADFCVPATEMESFYIRKAPFFSERDVIGFARRIQRHPGIVVGQIQRRASRYDFLRRYQVKMREHVGPSAITDGWGQYVPAAL